MVKWFEREAKVRIKNDESNICGKCMYGQLSGGRRRKFVNQFGMLLKRKSPCTWNTGSIQVHWNMYEKSYECKQQKAVRSVRIEASDVFLCLHTLTGKSLERMYVTDGFYIALNAY